MLLTWEFYLLWNLHDSPKHGIIFLSFLTRISLDPGPTKSSTSFELLIYFYVKNTKNNILGQFSIFALTHRNLKAKQAAPLLAELESCGVQWSHGNWPFSQVLLPLPAPHLLPLFDPGIIYVSLDLLMPRLISENNINWKNKIKSSPRGWRAVSRAHLLPLQRSQVQFLSPTLFPTFF